MLDKYFHWPSCTVVFIIFTVQPNNNSPLNQISVNYPIPVAAEYLFNFKNPCIDLKTQTAILSSTPEGIVPWIF